jgi:hypothetical protein
MKLGFVLIFAALASCSSGDDPQAPKRCDELAQSFCEINTTCALATAAITEEKRDESLSTCVSAIKQSFDCATVSKIKGDPDACIADLSATPCDDFDANAGLPIPDSCYGVFAR